MRSVSLVDGDLKTSYSFHRGERRSTLAAKSESNDTVTVKVTKKRSEDGICRMKANRHV